MFLESNTQTDPIECTFDSFNASSVPDDVCGWLQLKMGWISSWRIQSNLMNPVDKGIIDSFPHT